MNVIDSIMHEKQFQMSTNNFIIIIGLNTCVQ